MDHMTRIRNHSCLFRLNLCSSVVDRQRSLVRAIALRFNCDGFQRWHKELAADSPLPPGQRQARRGRHVRRSGFLHGGGAAPAAGVRGHRRGPPLSAAPAGRPGGLHRPRRCCGPAAMEDARRVANQLGIRFAALDYQEVFSREVIEYFFHSYAEGRTPNPCVECNRVIKFGRLLEFARALGADFLATGHYARTSRDPQSGRHLLRKGADRGEGPVLFPLRAFAGAARRRALPARRDDQGRDAPPRPRRSTCPSPKSPAARTSVSWARAITARCWPNDIRNRSSPARSWTRAGASSGLTRASPGSPSASGNRWASRPARRCTSSRFAPPTRTVVVGTKEELLQDKLTVGGINWIAFDTPPESLEAEVKIRYRQPEQPADDPPDRAGPRRSPLAHPAARRRAGPVRRLLPGRRRPRRRDHRMRPA